MGVDPLTATAIAIAAVGTGTSIYSGIQAAGDRKDAMRAENARNSLEMARQKREAIRAARISAASAQQSGENQGVSGSSAAIGGVGSIMSQGAANLSFLDQYQQLTNQASAANISAVGHEAMAQTAGDIAGLGFAAYRNPEAIKKFSNIFKPLGGAVF